MKNRAKPLSLSWLESHGAGPVVQARIQREQSGCWALRRLRNTASENETYPTLIVGKKSIRAFKVVWVLHHRKDWPAGAVGRHSCDRPSCINPDHVQPGTQAENMIDAVERGRHPHGRKTHCINGHELVGDNLRIALRNGREIRKCRACNRAAVRRNRDARLINPFIERKRYSGRRVELLNESD